MPPVNNEKARVLGTINGKTWYVEESTVIPGAGGHYVRSQRIFDLNTLRAIEVKAVEHQSVTSLDSSNF
jgi:hypothetical protein